MIHTDILFGDEASEKLLKGVNVMADAVSSILGPRGRNVAIARAIPAGDIYERIVLHDGVSVARSIELKDEFENMGAQLLKQAAQKQVDSVGDGTTVVVILARAIIQECMRMVSTGISPMELRKSLEDANTFILKRLEKLSIPLKTYEEMVHIATISAEDEKLGKLVADTLKKVGKDGVVDVEESKSPETTVEYQQGMQINKGYIHQLFVTNPERMEAVFEDPQILVTDKSITSLVPLTKLFTGLTSDKIRRPLVIISPDISGEALALLIQNKLQGQLFTLGIKAPSFGQDQKNILQDIAILTGARFITEDAGHKLEDVTVDDLGEVGYVTSNKNETIISKGMGSKEAVQKRIASIKTELEGDMSDFDRERLKSRLGKLTNGISVINVGGMTEVEMKERRERVIDAVAALRSAMDKGIVPGGEVVYLSALSTLKQKTLGEKILSNALNRPFMKLVENAGYNSGQKLSELKQKSYYEAKGLSGAVNMGFDVTDGQFKDMVKSGIVDPVEVSIQALKNSLSVSIQIVTTGCVIVPIKPEKK